MRLNDFSGGLNLRVMPTRIQPTEAVVYTNCDNESGALKSVKQGIDAHQDVSAYWTYFRASDKIVSSDEETYYQEYQNRLYAISKYSATSRDWNDRVVDMVIDKPTTAPVANAGIEGELLGTYQYCYTYYDPIDGRESAPSKLTAEIELEEKGGVALRFEPSSYKIRIYRTGGTLSSFTMVAEIEDSTYEDTNEDWAIAGNHVLTTIADGFNPAGTKYLTVSYSMLFTAKEDRVYFTEVAAPSVWREINFIDFDDTVTGMGATQHGLLVFTRYATYIVTGNSPSTLSKYLISDEQGCVDGRTVQFLDNNLLWLSTDGICASNGGKVEVISRNKLGKVEIPDILGSMVYDSMYMISNEVGTLIVDFRYNLAFRWIEEHGYLGRYNDKAFYSRGGHLYEMFVGEPSRLHYVSGILSEGRFTEYKIFKDFYIAYAGLFTLKVYAYGSKGKYLVLEVALPEDRQHYEVKQLGTNKSYGIEIEIEGVGEVYEIDFKAHGREK